MNSTRAGYLGTHITHRLSYPQVASREIANYDLAYMNNKPGKLTKVDLREIWKNEEYDFSKWLAEEENLALLSDEIGIAIRLPEKEALVGKYSVDIVAEEEGTARKIVIENQHE